jgi:hypothetical protein
MVALIVTLFAVASLAALLGVEMRRRRARLAMRTARRTIPRRLPHLEDKLRTAFDGPREQHGDIFVSYAVWRRDHETRMELFASDLFAQLNEFTRCLVVRHLWRALAALAEGPIVVVDSPPQTWSREINETFHDHGIDPWRVPVYNPLAPQFAKE